jgi:hypothetical protein
MRIQGYLAHQKHRVEGVVGDTEFLSYDTRSFFGNNCFTEMRSGSEEGSSSRLLRLSYHSSLGRE